MARTRSGVSGPLEAVSSAVTRAATVLAAALEVEERLVEAGFREQVP